MASLSLAIVALTIIASCGPRTHPPPVDSPTALDRVVADVCTKQIVLLGEPSDHGTGATIEVKAALVERLVRECGFSMVAFESGIYDFLDFEHAVANRSASREQLADAIGALWSTTREMDPLIKTLLGWANERRVAVVGLDVQIGSSTAVYAMHQLATDLTAVLEPAERASCRATIERHTNWQYNDRSPFDDTARQQLTTCLATIERALAHQPPSPRRSELVTMAHAFARSLAIADGDGITVRDAAMFDNLQWHLARLPGRRVIVWCATTHAAKRLPSELVPLGSHVRAAFGDRAAAIAFSAFAGHSGRPRRPPTELRPAPGDSLEGAAFAAASDELRYLDHRALVRLGVRDARAIGGDGEFTRADWSTIIDGLVVVRRERPPEFVRGNQPQRRLPTN